MIHRLLIGTLGLAVLPLSSCFEASIPLGERGRYGEAYVGYRLPSPNTILISESPLYRDK